MWLHFIEAHCHFRVKTKKANYILINATFIPFYIPFVLKLLLYITVWLYISQSCFVSQCDFIPLYFSQFENLNCSWWLYIWKCDPQCVFISRHSDFFCKIVISHSLVVVLFYIVMWLLLIIMTLVLTICDLMSSVVILSLAMWLYFSL